MTTFDLVNIVLVFEVQSQMYEGRLNVEYWSQRKGTDSCSVSYRFGDEKKPFYSIFQTNVSSRPTSSETIAIFFERLTPAQLKTILETHSILSDALDTIRDLHDLNLSEIRKLDECKWQLYNNFNIEEKE